MTPRPLRSTLFPYTTLFRSVDDRVVLDARVCAAPRRIGELVHEVTRVVLVDWLTRGARKRVPLAAAVDRLHELDRKSTRLNSSHVEISYAVFCLKKKNVCDE